MKFIVQSIGTIVLSFIILVGRTFASYDGQVLTKTDLGTYKIDQLQDTTYIIEHPCSNINSIRLRFPKSLLGQKIKITGADLGNNPTQVDIPGLEYRFCNLSMLLNDQPIEEVEEDLSYLMTVDYSVDKQWVKENEIDQYKVNLFTFLNNQKKWEDLPGTELFETEKSYTYTSTSEDDRSNMTLVTTGNVPEDEILHPTGKSTKWALLATLFFATLIYFMPKPS